MKSRWLLLAPLLALLACSTDIIDHGNGNKNASGNGSDAGPVRDAGMGQMAVDGGHPDAGRRCALAPRIGHDFGVLHVGQSAVGNFSLTNEFPPTLCTITSFAFDPPHPALTMSPPPTPVQQSMTFVPVTFAPTEPGVAETELVVRTTESTYRWPFRGVAIPAEEASTQTVTFEVSNTSTSALYVLTEGAWCDAFDVGVPRNLGFQCGCECPPPPTPFGRTYRRVEAGGAYAFTWDARSLATLAYDTPCGPVHLGDTAPLVGGALHPVAPGSYSIDVAYETSIPANCNVNGDELFCDSFEPAQETPPPVAELCPATQTVGVPFTLPATGDITVPVIIGN